MTVGILSARLKVSLCAAHSRMPAAAKEKLCERLEQAGIHLEQASHAWYQFLHLQHTDEDYSIRQASTFALLTAPVKVSCALKA